MGQIVSTAAKPKRCNANQLSQVPTPAAGEHILVSSDNSMNAAGQGNFDAYVVGNGKTAATALELKKINKLEEEIETNDKAFVVADADGNIAFQIDDDGVKAKNYHFCNADGEIIFTLEADSLDTIAQNAENALEQAEEVSTISSKSRFSSSEEIDGDGYKARFFAQREHLRDAYLGSEKGVYWDVLNGNDSNTGTSALQAVQTFSAALSLLNNGDTLYIARGSEINDLCNLGSKRGIKIDVFGTGTGNPLFNNFRTLNSASFEKVSGYNYIYRISVTSEACTSENDSFVQCFVDGERLGSDIYQGGLANKVSCRNIATYSDAMTYLDAHPDDACWFSGFEGGKTWAAGTYYWYVSLSTSPTSHTIEVTNHITTNLLKLENCQFTDIRHIDFRGGCGKDGVKIGRHVYMEDVNALDNPNYGFLLQGGEWWCYNCKIESLSGAVSTQFHYYGDNSAEHYDAEFVFIGCKVLTSGRIASLAFGGHLETTYAQPPCKEMVLVDCFCKGVTRCFASYMTKQTIVKNLRLEESASLGSGNYVYVDGVRGRIEGKDITLFYLSDQPAAKYYLIKNAVIMMHVTEAGGNSGIQFGQNNSFYNDVAADVHVENSKIIFYREYGAGWNIDQYVLSLPTQSTFTFKDCVIAVKNGTNYAQVMVRDAAEDNITIDSSLVLGVTNNITGGVVTDTTWGATEDISKTKYLPMLMYVDNGNVEFINYNL